MFWSVIIKSNDGLGEETTFDFKYIPTLSKQTQMEKSTEITMNQSAIERRNFHAFVIGCGLLCCGAYLIWTAVNTLVDGCTRVLGM